MGILTFVVLPQFLWPQWSLPPHIRRRKLYVIQQYFLIILSYD